MARKTTMTISVFNIVMPKPHSPERYVEALKAARGLFRPMKMWGDYSGLLETVHPHVEDGYVTGTIIRFLDLDLVRDWFNTETNRPASREEVNRRVTIPAHLKPHLSRTEFVFFPDSHMLFYVRQARPSEPGIGPSQLKQFFTNLFTSWELITEYGLIEVSIIPEMEAVEGILSHAYLRTLHITVKLPNPDGVADVSARVAARLEAENARAHEERLVADKKKYLQPDADRHTLARVAATHGSVRGVVGKRGESKTLLSTEDTPLIEAEPYNPETQTLVSVLLDSAKSVVQRLQAWQRSSGERRPQAQDDGDGT